MGTVNATGLHPECERIFEWLETISSPREKTSRRRSKIHLPTPSPSSRSQRGPRSCEDPVEPYLKNPNDQPNMQNVPRKRTIHDTEMESAPSEDASMDETPKVRSQQSRSMMRGRGARTRSTGAAPSATSSSRQSSVRSSAHSGISSPTKQVRRAATSATGFEAINFEGNLDRLPPQLLALWQSLRRIAFGQKLLPDKLRQEVQLHGFFPDEVFYDTPDDAQEWRFPSVNLVRDIFTRALECDKDQEGESSWNQDVHHPLLAFVFRNKDTCPLLDYRYCTAAQIIHEYKPLGAPAKTVDFCICIKPDPSSPEAEATQQLIEGRPGQSINHTAWGNFTKHPIGLSIETKGRTSGPWDQALLQIGTWHSAQWRSLGWRAHVDVTSLEFLPGIIVERHYWYFVASTLEGGRSKLYHRVTIGQTDTWFDTYKLVISLQCLAKWIEQEYWPRFKRVVLGMDPTDERQY